MEYGLGYVKDEHDHRDETWRSSVLQTRIPLPSSFKRKKLGPVLNQGQLPECVAFSTASLKMHQEMREHGKYYTFDPHWLYKECKKIDGSPNGDGTFLRTALQIVHDTGYLAKAAPKKLEHDTYFKVSKYVRLETVQQIKEAVYTVGPVVFGITVDSGIYEPDANGMVPPPNNDTVGGHAMIIVGWDNKRGAFLVKNSWGTSYGLKGYMWLPYSHFTTYPDWDAWRSIDLKEALN
jgi:C1A family cysteine protease